MSGLTVAVFGIFASASLAQMPGGAVTQEGRLTVTEGVLEDGDRVAPDNSLYDTHTFEGTAGETVIISLESETFDTYLALVDPNNQVLAQNDDISPENRNSEIYFTLSTDGQYTVIVNAYDETGRGPYQLSITATTSGATTAPSPDTPMPGQAEADALLQQGMQQYRSGQFAQAIATWQQALEQFQALGNESRISAVYNNLGEAYRSVGQYPPALDALQRSLDISQDLGEEDDTGSTLNNLGLVYLDLGRYDRAQGYFEKALTVARRTQNRYGEAVSLKNLGTAYYQLRNLQAALEANQQSLAMRREIGDRYGEAATLNSIGLIYDALGDLEKALGFFQQALVIDREVGNRAGESVVLGNIGRLYRRQGKLSEALENYQQSLVIYREVGDRPGEGTILNNIGFAQLALGQYDAATTQFEAAITIWESLGAQDLSDIDKISLFETQAQSYSGLQQILVAQGQVEAALTVAERGRTRALVEQLANRLEEGTTERLAAPDLATIRQIAQAQSATLVEYAIVDTELDNPALYIWVVQPDGTIHFEAIDLDQLDTPLQDLVQLSRAAVGDRNRAGISVVFNPTVDASSEPLTQLYEVLIQPIEAYLPTDPDANVIVIPQGNLFLVPFAALKNTQGQYLIEHHTLLTIPSIQTLGLTRRLQQSRAIRPLTALADEDLLIVGNPTMPSLPPLVGETPVPLPNLPGAEREAEAIAALFNTTALTMDEATEATIKQRLPAARVVHLATHGLLEYGQLEATGRLEVPGAVALAADSQEDGLLTAEEILQLSLAADLVVLSACDTGLGNITGDGVIGLSRSLMTAGVPSVVVSLWAVPDAPTAALMTTFYQQLQQGQSKAQALRQAMLTTLEDYPDPSAWAAFTLMGET
ncbi:MAG: CHAT domain-containing protein [Cyanobacteria bacterium J06635_15]